MGRQDAEGGVDVDPVTALGTTLCRPDGRVVTLADRAGEDPLLVAVVEHSCPVGREAIATLAATGARLAVVSQGRPEAAARLRDACGIDERLLLVEPAPHRVSDALAARRVPTFVLVEGLELAAWQDGWDGPVMGSMVARAGGGGLPTAAAGSRREGSPSRLTLSPEEQEERERADAGLVRPTDPAA